MFIPELEGLRSAFEELRIDQTEINKVINTLHTQSGDLHDSSFLNLRVPESAFGGSAHAGQLGYHHSRAQEVVSATLKGVVADLQRFRDGIQHAEKLVREADTDSAAELTKKRQATELLSSAAGYSEGDRRNHEARNAAGGEQG